MIYYGLKGSDGLLDTSENYNVAEADHSGYTFCKNEVFGDPLPSSRKKKYCFCDESVAMQDAVVAGCASEGENCTCEVGGGVIYGMADASGKLDLTISHYEMDANISGSTNCTGSLFGSKYNDGACFCEAPKPSEHNYCKKERNSDKEVGCYADERNTPDFEELLSSDVGSVAECTTLAFNASYIYAGLQAGH